MFSNIALKNIFSATLFQQCQQKYLIFMLLVMIMSGVVIKTLLNCNVCSLFIIQAIENLFRVCIARYENKRGLRICASYANPRRSQGLQNCQEFSHPSSVYIKLCKYRKKVFFCFYKLTFLRKKHKNLCYGTD